MEYCKITSWIGSPLERTRHSCIKLNPKKTGGGGLKGPPSTFRTSTLEWTKLSPRHLMAFFYEFPARFDTKFVTPGYIDMKLRNFLYMHVRPKIAPKRDFVYKSNAN